MKSYKSKHGGIKPSAAILILGCVGIAGVALWGLSSKQSNSVEETGLPDEIKESTIVEGNTATGTNIQSDTQPQTSGSIDSNKEEDQQLSESEVAAIKEEAIEEHRNRIMRNMAENLMNPGMNQIIANQQRVLMKDQYQDLVKSLNLNDVEASYFMDLVTARRMLQVDFGMKLMTGMLSSEEQQQLVNKLGEDTTPINEEIDLFLNNTDDAEYFKYYDRTEHHRTAIKSMMAEAQQSNIPFNDETSEKLVNVIYEGMNNASFSIELGESGDPDYSRLTDADINMLKQEMEALASTMAQRASNLITPEQLALFEKAYLKYVAAESERIKMIAQLTKTSQ